MTHTALISPPNRPLAAAATMLCAMFVIGFIDNFVVWISGDISVWQFHLMRSFLMLPILVFMSRAGLGALWPRKWRAVIGRSIILGVAMMLYFGALGFMSIAEALAGLFTSPIFVLLINVAFMGARIGIWRVLAVALGFAGILLVLQPGAGGFGPLMAMPVAGGAFYAVSAVATRSWCEGESTLALLNLSMIVLGLMGAAGLIVIAWLEPVSAEGAAGFLTRGWVWPVWHLAPVFALQVFGSLAGVFLLIRGYQMGEASYVSVFEYSVMVFGPLFAWVLFDEALGAWQALGIALIILAGVIILLRSR